MTRRDDVVGSLAAAQGFSTAQQVFAQTREDGRRVGLATIYRTLQSLADEGAVDVLRTDAGEVAYRLCATETHHHHLVCRECGATTEIATRSLESWAQKTAADHGFDQVEHVLEVFGRCAVCRARATDGEG